MINKAKKTASALEGFNDLALVAVGRTTLKVTQIFVLAIVLWAIFSLPAVLFGDWFPLDMGGIFSIGQDFQAKLSWMLSPYNGSGRYFPFYWIYNSLQFKLFGTNVSLYYLVQSLVFLAAALLTSATLYKVTKSSWSAALLLIAIYLSTPVAENLNTLGKAEPVSYLLIICIVLSFCHAHIDSNRTTAARSVFISLIFALAMWTKETSIAMFGFCLTGIFLSVAFGKFRLVQQHSAWLKDYLYLLIALLAGMGLAKSPYAIFPATLQSASYLDYDITYKLIRDNFAFYAQQQPDTIIFGALSIFLLTFAGRKLFLKGKAIEQSIARNYILVTSLFAMALAYYLVLLIWRWPMAYYMLLPALIFKLCAIYGVYVVYAHALAKKPFIGAIYGLMILSAIYAIFYIYYIASSQITYSRIYREALQRYLDAPGTNKSLIMESYPFYAEQVSGTGQLLSVDTGAEFRVKGIADVLDPAVTSNVEILKLLNVSRRQLDDNINNLPKAGDYLLTITGSKLATWFLRGVTPYYNEDSLLKTQGAYDMELVAERKIEVPALYVHIWSNNLVGGETSIGYKLYRVVDNEPRFLWRGRYPDGWIGKEASLEVNATYRRPVIIRFSAPSFALPNKVTIRKDGLFFKDIEITDTNEKVLQLSDISQNTNNFQFSVKNVIVPINIKLNKDTRELGLRMTIDMAADTSRQ